MILLYLYKCIIILNSERSNLYCPIQNIFLFAYEQNLFNNNNMKMVNYCSFNSIYTIVYIFFNLNICNNKINRL